MKRQAVLVVAAAALALSGCQTTGTGVQYVKYQPGPELETAKAQCKTLAAKASHVVIGIGGPEVVVGALIDAVIATGVKRAYVFENCMVMQGYRKADARTAPQPTAVPAAAPPQAPKATKKTPTRAG